MCVYYFLKSNKMTNNINKDQGTIKWPAIF